MDPISQGTVGAVFAQTISSKKDIVKITVIGCLAGMTPDLDILIQSREDPILFLEYHRQFTHSLIFIPFGSLFLSLIIFPFLKRSISFKVIFAASFLGYATHGLLDACTSYGTQLFWPFSDERISWNNVSIVDPLFTIPIGILIAFSITKRNKKFSFLAIGWVIIYLLFGFFQYERAYSSAKDLANSRSHNADRLTLKPSFGNLVLWKAIYQHEGIYFVDAIRAGFQLSWCPGETIEKLQFSEHLPALDLNSQQAKDINRFRWFSQDYLGYDREKDLVADIRYSMVPNEIEPMWGLLIDRDAALSQHASWWTSRHLDQSQLQKFQRMLTGDSCGLNFN